VQALADQGLGQAVSLGGALGLLHYLDYRTTHDVDAWWSGDVSPAQQGQVMDTVVAALSKFGPTRVRRWGDVVSVELLAGDKPQFSFQVARRSAQLEPSTPAPWAPVLLDSLSDLIAGKMAALVERGAPRDLRDIHALCEAELATPSQCWALWRRRQELAGAETSAARARLAIQTHLARIERHRPLNQIADAAARAQAQGVRGFLAGEFLDALEK
jgi:hypothetical protein